MDRVLLLGRKVDPAQEVQSHSMDLDPISVLKAEI